ncbi:histidine--tRNA ligase [Hufsiella ginkgonis]|uniref:Histidine--tRNA ligase n=1 Tax=Hufsiella ginkgonis TaxID=2695274 RepID=A0A7K1XV14_9SPHI|nr:histidine--tRNA ligase [Hufsiella ginkgonis]MXV14609.1 histidine--tRNA ligase [Hufsiella ginkgonis]
MATIKPAIPKGTRDFSPEEMVKRNYIFDTIRTVFKKYGYQEIQTPTMENLDTLTGKYGDEGDKLIFKVLNSGDFWAEAERRNQKAGNPEWSSKTLLPAVSEKALRYDLTVPFARYVVMHQNDITLPFKRFQVQPVWRADRPQKGRYREFYQCDADVVGSESLLNEAEFVLIYQEALSNLGLKDFTIKINNRKILSGIAEIIGKPELIVDMTVAIDKLDKVGLNGVTKELLERGFTEADIERLKPVILLEGTNGSKIDQLKAVLTSSETGLKGIAELELILEYVSLFESQTSNVEVDITLARGLNYYTGAIFEVKTNEVPMGSIGGGGRYDDLTGMFGLKGLTGVGISFGADRIYDVLQELDLFPERTSLTTQVLFSNFDTEAEKFALPLLRKLRSEGISAEVYPSPARLKKQLGYADDKKIPYVVLIGSEEMQSGLLSVKNMKTGEQAKVRAEQLFMYFKQTTDAGV